MLPLVHIKTTRRQNGSVKVPRHRYIKTIGTARGKRAIASLTRRAKKELVRLRGDSVVMPKKSAIPKKISVLIRDGV